MGYGLMAAAPRSRAPHGTTLSTVEMTAASRWYEVVEMAWPHSSVRAAET